MFCHAVTPQVGVSATTRTIRSRISSDVRFLPTHFLAPDSRLQHKRKPALCERSIVSGVALPRSEEISQAVNFHSRTEFWQIKSFSRHCRSDKPSKVPASTRWYQPESQHPIPDCDACGTPGTFPVCTETHELGEEPCGFPSVPSSPSHWLETNDDGRLFDGQRPLANTPS
jgi:hypothetical protein